MNKAIRRMWQMVVAIVLVHLGYNSLKRGVGRRAGLMFLFSLVIILLTIPWPFREAIGRGLFPGT